MLAPNGITFVAWLTFAFPPDNLQPMLAEWLLTVIVVIRAQTISGKRARILDCHRVRRRGSPGDEAVRRNAVGVEAAVPSVVADVAYTLATKLFVPGSGMIVAPTLTPPTNWS